MMLHDDESSIRTIMVQLLSILGSSFPANNRSQGEDLTDPTRLKNATPVP